MVSLSVDVTGMDGAVVSVVFAAFVSKECIITYYDFVNIIQ